MKRITIAIIFFIIMIQGNILTDNDFSKIFNVYKENAIEVCEGFKAGATSTLQGTKKNLNMYEPANVFDGNPKTIWSEGAAGPGIGEEIIFDIPSDPMPKGPQYILILNGNAYSKQLYLENNRIKELTVILYVGIDSGVYENYCTKYIRKEYKRFDCKLDDKMEFQKIKLNVDYNDSKAFWKKTRDEMLAKGDKVSTGEYGQYLFCALKIKSVYKGSKYDDTCISEISFE